MKIKQVVSVSKKSLLGKSLFFSPIMIVLVFLGFFYRKPFQVNPIVDIDVWNTYVVSDSFSNGNSSADFKIDHHKNLQFNYVLGDSAEYPYAFLNFDKIDNSFFDLSHYDYLELDIKATKGVRTTVAVFTSIPDFSKEDNFETFLRHRAIIFPESEFVKIKITFEELQIPSWWYTNNKLSEKDKLTPDWARTKTIAIGNCSNIEPYDLDQITIKPIIFYKDMMPYYLSSILFLLFSYSLLYLKSKLDEKKEELNDLLLNQKVEQNSQEKTLFEYIDTQYSNPDLTLSLIQDVLGITERKISSIVKEHKSLSFKQYLNNIRIVEAKRLLLLNDKNISEISYLVGYSNVTHFNRVFKSIETISPSDFKNGID